MEKISKVKLSPQKRKLVVQDLNKVLDEHRIFGQEWNIEVIQELILDNLTKNSSLELLKRLEETPISEWND